MAAPLRWILLKVAQLLFIRIQALLRPAFHRTVRCVVIFLGRRKQRAYHGCASEYR